MSFELRAFTTPPLGKIGAIREAREAIAKLLHLIVEQNIADVGTVRSLTHSLTKSPHYFQNQTPSGALSHGTPRDTMETSPDLETMIADALAFSLF